MFFWTGVTQQHQWLLVCKLKMQCVPQSTNHEETQHVSMDQGSEIHMTIKACLAQEKV
jgi:hypothetical protein